MWALSRRSRRYRANLAVTLQPIDGGDPVVCRTRDVSDVGMLLDTAARYPLGTRLAVALVDPQQGIVVEVDAEVVREALGAKPQLGLRIAEPSDDWRGLVAQAAAATGPPESRTRRLRVLVIGDDQRQRGAMALYVTSGWDVLFAAALDTLTEALGDVAVDAVIAEIDGDDPRWRAVMREARRLQPAARRIVRGAVASGQADELVDRFVDRQAGLEALLDALTADLPR
jgi:hypothetical protein